MKNEPPEPGASRLESAACLFGHTAPPEKLFDRPDWWFELPGAFAWHRCPACGLRFLSPRPSPAAMADYYPEDYRAYRPAIDDERWAFMRWKRRRNLRPQVAGVERLVRPGRLLDVGCATGNYLAEMRRRGWQVEGVEPQVEAAEYARRRLKLTVHAGDLLSAALPDGRYDVVTLWDVLEHTHDPLAVMREVRRLLAPGGLVAFSIPDPASWEARFFGPAWIGYDAPRHLHIFTGNSLRLLLQAAGLQWVAESHFMATYHTWLAGWHTQLNRRWPDGRWRRLLVRLAYLPIWAPLTAPFFAWLNRRGQGSIITLYATRDE